MIYSSLSLGVKNWKRKKRKKYLDFFASRSETHTKQISFSFFPFEAKLAHPERNDPGQGQICSSSRQKLINRCVKNYPDICCAPRVVSSGLCIQYNYIVIFAS